MHLDVYVHKCVYATSIAYTRMHTDGQTQTDKDNMHTDIGRCNDTRKGRQAGMHACKHASASACVQTCTISKKCIYV